METTNNHLVSIAKDVIDKALERFISETDISNTDPQIINDAWIEALGEKLREWMPTEKGDGK